MHQIHKRDYENKYFRKVTQGENAEVTCSCNSLKPGLLGQQITSNICTQRISVHIFDIEVKQRYSYECFSDYLSMF